MSDSLPSCNIEVYCDGRPLLAADTSDCGAAAFDAWVGEVTVRSSCRVDWHYSGGVAQVLYLGDHDDAIEAARSLPCPARIMRWFDSADPGLYRYGITLMPPGAVAIHHEGGGGSTFAVEEQ